MKNKIRHTVLQSNCRWQCEYTAVLVAASGKLLPTYYSKNYNMNSNNYNSSRVLTEIAFSLYSV